MQLIHFCVRGFGDIEISRASFGFQHFINQFEAFKLSLSRSNRPPQQHTFLLVGGSTVMKTWQFPRLNFTSEAVSSRYLPTFLSKRDTCVCVIRKGSIPDSNNPVVLKRDGGPFSPVGEGGERKPTNGGRGNHHHHQQPRRI